MSFFTGVVLLVYLSYLTWLWTGLKSAACGQPASTSERYTPFSIIIAAHNEEETIGETLRSLSGQQYAREYFEIIVVADRCTDRTAEIVRNFTAEFSVLNLIEIDDVPEGISPKKNALQKGLAAAKFENLILMDADCIAGKDYLSVFNSHFFGGSQLVVNIPKVRFSQSLLHRYLLPERLVTWSIAAAGVGHRRPFLAFGGSWAYTRELFTAAGGMGEIAKSLSGDDDLLIYRMGRLRPNMAVCLDPRGWVTTGLPSTWKEFFFQRRRHHSAGKFYSTGVQIGYAGFHLSNLLLWLIPIFAPVAAFALLAKFCADFFVLKSAGKVFREPVHFTHFAIFEISYLVHNVLIAPLGFIGKVRWK